MSYWEVRQKLNIRWYGEKFKTIELDENIDEVFAQADSDIENDCRVG